MNTRYNTMTAKALEHERERSFMKAADCWAKASRAAMKQDLPLKHEAKEE